MSAVAPRKLGRFELRRELGRGAQASVWLAHDPRLEREVAVKLLLDPAAWAAAGWLDEARAVSRLTHPNIVPVFEADEGGGRPYLVFEFVDGPTLAAAMRGRGAWPAREAVPLMLGVLDALAAAHAQGVVHRDLKPSNILLGRDGRARVMDFGIAARVAGPGVVNDGRIVGTPGYISPEAARGAAPVPAMDVFSAGVVLAELLAGERLLRESDPMRAVQRVQTEDLVLPAVPGLEEPLRAVVQRALSRDAAQRFDSAESLASALRGWLQPDAAPRAEPAAGHGTIDFLLRRMRLKGDFPALSESVSRIQRVALSETENLASLSGEILKDVALTQKLLRMVNSAHFSAAGGPVSTISRAVALVGFAGIRNMALSLLLLEHMQDKGHAAQLKESFAHALLAGQVAGDLARDRREGEEVFLGSMFQNLGRLLTQYYFAEEWQQIARQLAPNAGLAEQERAAVQVLGIGFEDLGVAVARSWGLPDNLLRAMRAPAGDPPARALDSGERPRWMGRAGNELAAALLTEEGAALEHRLAAIAGRHAAALGLKPAALLDAAQGARERIGHLAQAMGLQLAPGRASRALQVEGPAAPDDSLSPHRLQATLAVDAPTAVLPRAEAAAPAPPAPPPGAMAELLAAGIQDITNTMVADDFKLNEVLRMVMETMWRALSFRRVVFCLRDPKTDTLTGRFGLGDGVEAASRAFRVALKGGPEADLFTAVCAKGADTLIADATAPNIAQRLPAWYRQAIDAPAFLLLPLSMKNAPFGLLYADKAEPGGIVLGEKELSMLRTLRNQAVMAFRQRAA